MKRILAICNTYSQLLVAMRLRETIWLNDSVHIIISDQSRNTEKIAKKLVELKLFSRVIYIKNKDVCLEIQPLIGRVKRFFRVMVGSQETDKQIESYYDELVYYNSDVWTYDVFANLIRRNPHMICSRYEEGILSYGEWQYLKRSTLKYANAVRNFLCKPVLESRTKNFYCYYPRLYKGTLATIQIPQIIDYKEMGDRLRYLFGLNESILEIKEKYIFFTSVYDFEGGSSIGEFDVVCNVANIVGKDNLLIKTHPRDTRTVYEENGFHVYGKSTVPWEAIQFNNDFSDNCFLTINSSSVLVINTMLKKQAKAFFLYNCCHLYGNEDAINSAKNIEEIIKEAGHMFDDVVIIQDFDDLKERISVNHVND